MLGYRNNRVLPIALTLIGIAIVIAALVSMARIIFLPNSGNKSNDISREVLLGNSVDRAVQMKVRGPIVSDEDFRSYKILITPSKRYFVSYQGYLEKPIDNISLVNNFNSYEQFVYALDGANLTKGSQFEKDKNDLRGVCASGRLYEFEILDGSKVIKQLWTSSCSKSKGSLDAKIDVLKKLFTDQIPKSQIMIDKIWQ